ncbi:MAG: SDR family oxidoreductase [Gemmatimonadales bacterium]
MATARVIITAGAGGIGRKIAERFHRDGARLHVCDIDAAALADAAERMPGLTTSRTDLGDPAAVAAMVAEAAGLMGGVDVLVNNHGIAGPRGWVEELDVADWEHCLRVNLTGMFVTIKHVVPHFKAQRHGAIINLATTSARTQLPKRTAYVVSKAGVLGLTHQCARELGPWNIRVNAVLPGFIDNARGRGVLARVAQDKGVSVESLEQDALRFVSMRTWIGMEEIAGVCAFLASDEARHVSGQEIAVDGNVEWEE